MRWLYGTSNPCLLLARAANQVAAVVCWAVLVAGCYALMIPVLLLRSVAAAAAGAVVCGVLVLLVAALHLATS